YTGTRRTLCEAREHGRRRAIGRSLPLSRRANARPLSAVRLQRRANASRARGARGLLAANELTALDSARPRGASPTQESARILRLSSRGTVMLRSTFVRLLAAL